MTSNEVPVKKGRLKTKKTLHLCATTRPARATMGVHTKFVDDDEGEELKAVVVEAKEEVEPGVEEEEDVSKCPTFIHRDENDEEETEDNDDLPRRNLDAAFASTPTLPKKRRMPMIVDNNAAGAARQLPVARAGLGGATGDDLSLERMQVSGRRTYLSAQALCGAQKNVVTGREPLDMPPRPPSPQSRSRHTHSRYSSLVVPVSAGCAPDSPHAHHRRRGPFIIDSR